MIAAPDHEAPQIRVIEADAVPFESYTFDWAPSGYDVAGLTDRVAGTPGNTPISVFPNHLMPPSWSVFVVNHSNGGCLAIYLGMTLVSPVPARNHYLFGFVEPLTVFAIPGERIKALHWAGIEMDEAAEQLHIDALARFHADKLANSAFAFSVNQNWRPWHEQLQ